MPPCAPHAECAPQKDRPCRRRRCVHRKQPAPRIRPRYPATPTSPWIHPPSAMSTKDIRSKDRRNRRPPTALPRDNAPDHSRSRRSVRRRIVAYPSSVYPRKLDAGEFSEDSEQALPIHPLSHTESHPSPASTIVILSKAKDLCNLRRPKRCRQVRRSFGPQTPRASG